jgi:protocatechuate 3,4-dioxygenase beta subunit
MVDSVMSATLSRRRMLAVGFGAVYSTVAAACSGVARSTSSVSPSPLTSASPTGAAVATPACIVTPSETEGPYFVEERLQRADITVDPSDGSVRPGRPLSLTFTVAKAGSPCTALSGAQVDVWHCDAQGLYSDVPAEGSVGRRFLRGYQITNAGGSVTFATIYPGWYRGRAVHVHFKVRTFSGSTKTFESTSQIFFDDAISDEVYKQVPYSTRGSRDTRNANDMVYASNGNSGSRLLASASRTATGFSAAFAVGLNLS